MNQRGREPMRMETDVSLAFTAPNGYRSKCRVRVFEPEDPERDAAVVILTEIPDNPGMSITNAAQVVAAEVLRLGFVAAGALLPVYIEHYRDGVRGTREDPHTFDLVTFDSYDVREVLRGGVRYRTIGEPRWKALDRATVEQLVGRVLD